eukprot:TRINITY_DN245_c0_g2_i1.p1 TRINITY_DN245_c0_g2~~TRINITY_DN245_c0_g2_i1.p1  ORF type:complete len:574 (-),score=137.75 TRINITY_DN245_c0_g2_i1:1044-2765(-)
METLARIFGPKPPWKPAKKGPYRLKPVATKLAYKEHEHPLTEYSEPFYPSRGFRCDGCEQQQAPGRVMHCDTCGDYDVCPSCFEPRDAGFRYAVYAGHPHRLQYYSRGGAYHIGFICDVCDVNRGVSDPVYHCGQCSYDVCAPCLAKAGIKPVDSLTKRAYLSEHPSFSSDLSPLRQVVVRGVMSREQLGSFRTRRCQTIEEYGYGVPEQCFWHHSAATSTRRNPFVYQYTGQLCPSVSDRYNEGYCWQGDNCNRCHSLDEYRYHPENYKATLCSTYNCRNGLCPNAHGRDELVTHDPQDASKMEANPSGVDPAELGAEIFLMVLAWLPTIGDVGRAARVSRRWRDHAQDDFLWKGLHARRFAAPPVPGSAAIAAAQDKARSWRLSFKLALRADRDVLKRREDESRKADKPPSIRDLSDFLLVARMFHPTNARDNFAPLQVDDCVESVPDRAIVMEMLHMENDLRLSIEGVRAIRESCRPTDVAVDIQRAVVSKFGFSDPRLIQKAIAQFQDDAEVCSIPHYVKFNRSRQGEVRQGDQAPDVPLCRLASLQPTSLHQLMRPNVPLVVVAGSYT